MLFKYPELLWGLLLLIIPVLIHLLRLRRFRKTPFTNVRILRRLQVEANRSSRLKKWLLLLCRLGLLAALALAFAQPYQAEEEAGAPREIAVYIDNSFSMQAPEERSNLMENAVQALLQQLPPEFEFGLLTNSELYRPQRLDAMRETLLDLDFSPSKTDAASLMLRARSLFSDTPGTIRELWMFSDFQDLDLNELDTARLPRIQALPTRPRNRSNISLDTAYIRNRSAEILELEVGVTLDDPSRNPPLSLYSGDTLLAKSAPELEDSGHGQAIFSLPAGQSLTGAVRLLDEGLPYDNNLYFNLTNPPRIRVFSLGPGPTDFLSRIYTEDEFELQSSVLQEADYALLESQHLIILNEIPEIPEPLIRILQGFVREGGGLVVIPAPDASLLSYNQLLQGIGMGLDRLEQGQNRVTEIAFGHPLFRDVFEAEVTNFEFPTVASHYVLSGSGDPVLGYQNGLPFLASRGKTYLFSAALNPENSNFRQSPLIVPTLYAIGKSSLPFPDLYYTIGTESGLELDRTLEEDRIFALTGEDYEFIPRQQAFARRTRLTFSQEPVRDGNYALMQGDSLIRSVSFNFPRDESSALYPPLDFPNFVTVNEDPEALIGRYQNDTRITALWKWFVILALLFVLAELILQKVIR